MNRKRPYFLCLLRPVTPHVVTWDLTCDVTLVGLHRHCCSCAVCSAFSAIR